MDAAEIAHEDRLIEVRAREATLVLDMDGLEEDLQRSRFGDLQLEAEHRKKVTRDVTTEGKLAGKAAAKGTLTPVGPLGSLSAEASAQGQRSFKTVEKDKEDIVLRRVVALPNGRWTFQEPDGAALKGTYLLGTKLCSLRRKEGANRIAVVGRLLVKQRDLTFHDDDPSWRDRLSRSKQRLFDLFLTHVLSGDVSHRAPGMFFLSRVEIEP